MAARSSPRWPRALLTASAAEYAGYRGERAFLAAVATGEMPAPFRHADGDRWDIQEIDEALDAIKAGAARVPHWKAGAPDRV
ncbi:MAG: hypothetical protein AB7G25_07720 [Sphingomonadaceae bacterium]